jgi:hypothetical protein
MCSHVLYVVLVFNGSFICCSDEWYDDLWTMNWKERGRDRGLIYGSYYAYIHVEKMRKTTENLS